MRRIDNDSSSRRTIEHQPPLSASTSLRRLFAQPALSPNTPGLSVEFLAQKIGPKLDEQSNKGEGISVHIKSFFKNLSKQWHLQEEIDKTNQNPAAAINERECRSEIEFSAYWYGEFAEELKDHSNVPRRESRTTSTILLPKNLIHFSMAGSSKWTVSSSTIQNGKRDNWPNKRGGDDDSRAHGSRTARTLL